jgi:type IV secretory pathway VirB4 component
MRTQKIDRKRLHDMLKAGKTQKECAAHFGVSEVAIWKAKKELNINVVRSVALESAHRVAEDNLDAVSQLRKINDRANTILDDLMEKIKKEKGTGERKKDLREIAIKSMAEIRNQLALQLDIMKTLTDVTAIAEFQKEVVTTIGEANRSPCCEGEVVCAKCGQKVDLRSLIIERLKQARALRSGVTFKP